jgi:hypothetical protein
MILDFSTDILEGRVYCYSLAATPKTLKSLRRFHFPLVAQCMLISWHCQMQRVGPGTLIMACRFGYPEFRTNLHSISLLAIPSASDTRSISLDFEDFVFGTSWPKIYNSAMFQPFSLLL